MFAGLISLRFHAFLFFFLVVWALFLRSSALGWKSHSSERDLVLKLGEGLSGLLVSVTVTAVRRPAVIWPGFVVCAVASAETGPDKGPPLEQMKVSADCLETKRKLLFLYFS